MGGGISPCTGRRSSTYLTGCEAQGAVYSGKTVLEGIFNLESMFLLTSILSCSILPINLLCNKNTEV